MNELIKDMLNSIAELRRKLYAMSRCPLTSDSILTLSQELDELVLMYHKAIDEKAAQ